MRPVLGSWKEIAQYLGKGVRTAQRWERELGLPVRRAWGKDKRVVLAVPDDLDAWIRRQRAGRAERIERLERENAVLRAENAALRLQLGQSTGGLRRSDASAFDYSLLMRSADLIRKTAQLREYTNQLLTRMQAQSGYGGGLSWGSWSGSRVAGRS